MNIRNSQNIQSTPSIPQPARRWRIDGRTALYILALVAPLAWAALLLYARFVPPQGVLAFAAFFILLDVALTSTFTPLAYVIGLRFISPRLYRTTVRHALRQGALLALLLIAAWLRTRQFNFFYWVDEEQRLIKTKKLAAEPEAEIRERTLQ